MEDKPACGQCEEPHFYGGQAVIEGVMMRGTDRYAVAVRRPDGEVVLGRKQLNSFAERHKWAKWPLIRGNVGLIESLVLGLESLQFSADVAAQAEREAARTAAGGAGTDATPDGSTAPGGLGAALMGLTTVLAMALGIGLFVILPTWVVDWLMGKPGPEATYGASVVRNLVEGGLRLVVIVLYIVAISAMKYVRRVFEYHGAEHATINCLESGEPVTVENCLRFGPLHPRCGTAFLLVVVLVKMILGCFFGWPVAWARTLIRLALLPVVAGIAYEVIRWAGRHRNSLLSRALAAPGMFMQILTTRRPDASQIEVAMIALAHVASEFSLPEGWARPRELPIPLSAKSPAAPASGQATDPQPDADG